MNLKTLTTLVGTLSLGSLATGCATAQPAMAPAPEPATQVQQVPVEPKPTPTAEAAPPMAPAVQKTSATPSSEKGKDSGCGASGCGASGCGAKK